LLQAGNNLECGKIYFEFDDDENGIFIFIEEGIRRWAIRCKV